MANPVKTIWTVTWEKGTPEARVLVSPDLLLEEEFSGFSATQKTEAGGYLEADDESYLAFGNTGRGAKFTVYKDHATPAAARDYIFEVEQSIPVRKQGTVTFEVAGGSTWTASGSVFKSWNTAPVRKVGKHRTAFNFELECGKISLGTPSGPDPIGLESSAVNLLRKSAMLNAGGTAAGYREGVAAWDNTGTGDDAVQATGGNQPKHLIGPALYLPGVQYNNFSSVTSQTQAEFGISWAGILPSYTPAARVCLASKWAASVNDCQWALFIETTGQITLSVSPNGTLGSATSWTSALPVGIRPNGFMALSVTRDATAVRFAIFPSLEWTNAIEFSPPIASSSIVMVATNQPLVIGSTNFGGNDLGEMRVQQVRFVPNLASNVIVVMDFSGRGESTGTSGIERRYAGTDPMAEMFGTSSYCARFDGTNDSLALPTPVPLNAVSGCSIFLICQVHRTTGTNDLVFLGSNDADPRILLRMEGGALKLIVRRLDAEAVATISTTVGIGAFFLSASIDYAAGKATLYTNRIPRAVGGLTSAGVTSATDSSETRIGAGQGGANAANLDLLACHIVERATDPIEHDALWQEIIAANNA